MQHFIIGHISATTACHDDDYMVTAVQNHNCANNNAMADEPNPEPQSGSYMDLYGPNFDNIPPYDMPRDHDPFVDNYPPPRDNDGRTMTPVDQGLTH